MAFDFRNKRVVVTGGSRGIGRAIALGFAACGADVSVCSAGGVGRWGSNGLKSSTSRGRRAR